METVIEIVIETVIEIVIETAVKKKTAIRRVMRTGFKEEKNGIF